MNIGHIQWLDMHDWKDRHAAGETAWEQCYQRGQWDKPDHRNAPRVVRSLAFQLATRLPDYRKLLLTLPEIAELDRKDVAELFDYLLANPLRSVTRDSSGRNTVVCSPNVSSGNFRTWRSSVKPRAPHDLNKAAACLVILGKPTLSRRRLAVRHGSIKDQGCSWAMTFAFSVRSTP